MFICETVSLMGVDASLDARCQGSCEPLEKTMREAAWEGGREGGGEGKAMMMICGVGKAGRVVEHGAKKARR